MDIRAWPRTDFGTVALHWATVASVFWLTATGLRIASDDEPHRWLSLFDNVMPTTQLWLNHLLGAFILTMAAIAYVAYVFAAGLFRRIRLDAARLSGLSRGLRARTASINVLLYWIMFVALVLCIGSGWLLMIGSGGYLNLQVHYYSMMTVLAFVPAHLLVMLVVGGIGQMARIFRPSRLVKPTPMPDLADLVAELLAARKISPSSQPSTLSHTGGRQTGGNGRHV